MSYKYPFLDVYKNLSQVIPDLVLVGGWVPTVYFEYEWKVNAYPIQTRDVDIGLSPNVKIKKKLVSQSIDSSQYTQKHFQLGKLTPYQVIYQGKIPVDFLSDPEDIKHVQSLVLGNDILLHPSTHYRFLLEKVMTVVCEGLKIRVPQMVRYIIHKIHVYLQNPQTRQRDMATVFYCLSRSPRNKEIKDEIISLKKSDVFVKKTMNQLSQVCNSKDSRVILEIKKILSGIGMIEENENIFDEFKELL